jgi:hypothetical protein
LAQDQEPAVARDEADCRREAEQPDWVKAVIADIEATGKTEMTDDAQAAAAWKLLQPRYAEARRNRRGPASPAQCRRPEQRPLLHGKDRWSIRAAL